MWMRFCCKKIHPSSSSSTIRTNNFPGDLTDVSKAFSSMFDNEITAEHLCLPLVRCFMQSGMAVAVDDVPVQSRSSKPSAHVKVLGLCSPLTSVAAMNVDVCEICGRLVNQPLAQLQVPLPYSPMKRDGSILRGGVYIHPVLFHKPPAVIVF